MKANLLIVNALTLSHASDTSATAARKRSSLRSLGWSSLACLALLVGCAAPAEDDVDTGGAAISDREVAAKYDVSKKLFSGQPASEAVQKLGATTWSGYLVANANFSGVAFFAANQQGDVALVMLQSAMRDAGGKAPWVGFKVDRDGSTTGSITPEESGVLRADIKRFAPLLKQASDSSEDPRSRKCANAVLETTVAAVGIITGTAVATNLARAAVAARRATIVIRTSRGYAMEIPDQAAITGAAAASADAKLYLTVGSVAASLLPGVDIARDCPGSSSDADEDCSKGWQTCSGGRWVDGVTASSANTEGTCRFDGKDVGPGVQRSKTTGKEVACGGG
jgi:hypothetical protein